MPLFSDEGVSKKCPGLYCGRVVNDGNLSECGVGITIGTCIHNECLISPFQVQLGEDFAHHFPLAFPSHYGKSRLQLRIITRP
jgi:hypothetical protein